MSDTIDTRVVEMQFDNKDFEKNVKTSMDSLEQLKKSLDLEGAAKGFTEIDKAAKNVDLSSMAASLDTVSKRFSTMGIVGTTILQRITNAAINAAKRIASNFPPRSVMEGFQEYETQIDAVQTILANTSAHFDELGYTQQERLDVINTKLDELNHYADKTIYNFTQMTRNIGTFTAAGIELNVAVDSIQGIANLAAVSGSTSQQASTAMYQLSQALASGTVKLMDWNSVVNAGMGGKTFQDALIRTADVMGVTGEKAQEMFAKLKSGQVSFRDSLSSGWLSSDILTATLQQLSWDFEEIAKKNGLTGTTAELIALGREIKKTELLAQGYTEAQIEEILNLAQTASDAATKVKTFTQLRDTLREAMQSGWTQSWEYIIGDFDEAKALWTGFSDFFSKIIEASSDARNKVLKEWHDFGGRDTLFNNDPEKGPLGAVWNLIYGIQNIVNRVKGKISGLFPSKSDENILLRITKRIQGITAAFYKLTEAPSLSEGFKNLFGEGGLRGKLQETFHSVYENIKEYLKNLKIAQLFEDGFDWHEFGYNLGFKIGDFIKSIFGSLFQSSDKSLSEIAQSIGRAFGTFFTVTLPNKLANIGEWFKGTGTSIWQGILEGLKTAVKNIGEFIRGFVDGFKEALGIHSPSTVMRDEVGVFMGQGLLEGLAKPFKAIGAWLRDHIILPIVNYVKEHNIGEMVKGWFDPEKLKDYWATVKRVIGTIVTGLRTFFTETIPSFLESHNINAKTIRTSIQDSPIGAFGNSFIEFLRNVRQGISDGWGNFSSFVSKLFGETIPNILESKGFENLLKFILGLRGLTAFGGIWSLGSGLKNIGKGFSGIGESVKSIGSSIGTIAESIKTVGGGVGNIGDAIKEVVKNGITITQKKKTEALGTTILKIAAAIGILVGSLWVLSQMKEEDIIHGLEVIGVLAAGLLAVSFIFKKIHVDGKPLLQLAGATLILALSVKMLSKMDWGAMLKGLTGLGLLLLELAVFMRIAGKGFDGKTAFISLAVGVGILVMAMKSIAKMDWSDIGKGLAGIGALLLELSLFMRLAGKGFANKTAFFGIAIAVNLLVLAVKQICKIDSGSLTKGLTGLGVLLLELGLFMRLTNKGFANKTAFLGLAVAVEILVLAVKQIGNMDTGKLMQGLIGLGVMFTMLGSFLKKTGNITKIGGMIAMAIAVNLLVRAIQKLGRMKTGQLIKGVLALGGIMTAFGFLAKSAKGMKVGSMITSLILFAGTIGLFFAAFEFLGKNEDMDSMLKFATAIGELLLALSISMKVISTIPITGALSGLGSFAILVVGLGAIVVALGYLKQQWSGLTGFLESGGDVLGGLGTAIGKFVGGIVSGFMGMAFDLPQIGSDLSTFMENASGFVAGAKNIDPSIAANVAALAGAIIAIGVAEFINAVIGLFGGGQPVTAFCDDIVALGQALSGFSFWVSSIDNTKIGSATTGLVGLAGAIVTIGLSEFANAVIGLFGGGQPVTAFCEDIVNLGKALCDFQTSIAPLNTDEASQAKIDAAIAIAKCLAELEKSLEAQGGLADKFVGVKSLSTFSEGFQPFAEGMNAFVTELNKIDFEQKDLDNFPILMSMATALAELEKSLEAQGGLTDKFEGTKSLSHFGNEVPAFGEGMNSFVTELKKVNFTEEDLTNFPTLISMATSLSELEKSLEAQGGLVDKLEGVKSLAVFGGEVPKFGEGMNGFLTEIKKIDYNEETDKAHLDGVLEVAKTLNEFEATLNKQNGMYQWLVGEQNIGTFGDNLKLLGEGLATFASSLGDVSTDKTTSALEVMGMVQTFVGGLEETGGLWQNIHSFFSGDQWKNLSTLTGNMATLGTDLITFSSGLENVEESKSKFESAKELFELFQSFVNIADSDHMYTIFDLDPVESMLYSLSTMEFPEFNTSGLTAATTFLSGLKEGIQNDEESLTIVAVALSTSMVSDATGIRSTYQTWFDAGGYLASGLSAGINSMASTVSASAVSVAAGAIRSIQMTWSVHSPSKVAEDMAMFFDLGLAGGFTGYSKVVSGAAVDVAKGAVDSAKTMLLADGSSIFDNIDPNPTIRPVLDLTNLQNGVGQIAGMFNSNPMMNAGLFRGFNFSKGVNALNFDGARIVGGQNNRDVVSELEVLGDRMDALGDAVTNMQLVLDTGALVGGTSAKMNNQLGTLAMRSGRAN